MHPSSHATMREFVRVHLDDLRGTELEVLDFGSQVVEGQPLSYVDLIDDPAWHYRGLDIEAGANVDIVVDNAYDWSEVETDSIDVVISGQALEHVEYFWASIFEIVRVLKPGGIAAIIAPSSGFEHRYPVDCWRFYRDGFAALGRYVGATVLDVFTDWNHGDWDDSILVVEKPVWNDDERRAFALRSAMQRALLSPDPASFDPTSIGDLGPAAEPSPLRGRTGGALTAVLERNAAERIEGERAAAQIEAEEFAVQRAAEIAAEADRIAAARIDGITPLRIYGKVRSAFANLVGERGREAYRRVRGRAATS